MTREPGATFDPASICWIDWETRGDLPITVGTDRYSYNAYAIILAWAIGDGPVGIVAVSDFPQRCLGWDDMPADLRAAYERVAAGNGVFCAHNANFDRAIWNNSTVDFPLLEPWMIIDTRAQAAAAGLPASLDMATKQIGIGHGKDPRGKALIKLFCLPDSEASPQSHPDEWADFQAYAKSDIHAMRDLFAATRQLPLAEWEEYWVSETINDRGVSIDIALAESAARMAAEDGRRSAIELAELTGNIVTSVNQVARLTGWLQSVLPAEGRAILVEEVEERDDDGEVIEPEKTALTRKHVERLLAYLDSFGALWDPLRRAQRALQIRLYGGSKTPAKFKRMADSHVGGVIRGQYVFNGASQTGRFSAKGIQIHNLAARDYLPFEIDAIDALLANAPYDELAVLGDDAPVSRKLSLLIRPTLVAQPGHVFCWGDWSNIEARIAPWLARDRDADKVLDIYRAFDEGREQYDVYTHVAAALSSVSLEEVTKEVRQRGKVTSLACQFGGGANALLNMAAAYGMHLEESEAKAAVERWREANPWAPRFWQDLWTSVTSALKTPGRAYETGRVSYVFVRDYLGGSLLCRLPSGRYLTYRRIGWERTEVRDDDGKVTDVREDLVFSRDQGRIKLWPGLCCENIVQATAADILRETLVVLDAPAFDWMPVRLHTHDEVLIECRESRSLSAAAALQAVMEEGFDWTDGLPIAADTTVGRFYSKNPASIGL